MADPLGLTSPLEQMHHHRSRPLPPPPPDIITPGGVREIVEACNAQGSLVRLIHFVGQTFSQLGCIAASFDVGAAATTKHEGLGLGPGSRSPLRVAGGAMIPQVGKRVRA
ncbi:unnamed protein product, partial [Discosporangium mesarthrocarpum]